MRRSLFGAPPHHPTMRQMVHPDTLDHLRIVGRANVAALNLIAANLHDVGFARSRVRILDSLLWMSHPATSLARSLPDWEHVIRFVEPRLQA